MKKYSLFGLLLMCIFTFVGCWHKSTKSIERGVREANAECPIDLGAAFKLTSVQYLKEDSTVICTYVAKNSAIDLTAYNTAAQKRAMSKAFSKGEQVIGILDRIRWSDARLVIMFQDANTTNRARMSFSNKEIAKILDARDSIMAKKGFVVIETYPYSQLDDWVDEYCDEHPSDDPWRLRPD